jgi:hypothetical protein
MVFFNTTKTLERTATPVCFPVTVPPHRLKPLQHQLGIHFFGYSGAIKSPCQPFCKSKGCLSSPYAVTVMQSRCPVDPNSRLTECITGHKSTMHQPGLHHHLLKNLADIVAMSQAAAYACSRPGYNTPSPCKAENPHSPLGWQHMSHTQAGLHSHEQVQRRMQQA